MNRFKQISNFLTLLDMPLMYGGRLYSPLVYSKISYGMLTIIELSCTFSMILWIQSKKMFVFNYKEHKWEDILRYKRQNFQPSKQIPIWDPIFTAYHNSSYSLLYFKYFYTMGWVSPKRYAIIYDCNKIRIVNSFQSIEWHE